MSLLDIVSTEDEQFMENYPKIMKKIEKKKLIAKDSNIDEINRVYEIINDYIKINKRKVYGGYALNKLLIAKNPSLAIYDETDVPDIEFYSSVPLDDLVKLCNILNDAGFKNVVGQEAQHKETYSIFVNFQLYCDISYMPSNIYNKIRYIKYDDFNLVHPWFMAIDFFRMFTDPMISYWRLEKHFSRYLKLQKTYPLPLIIKPLDLKPFKNDILNSIINLFQDFLSEKSSIIFTGFYIYNYYLVFSKYNKKDTRFSQIQLPYLEVYSSEYVTDGLSIIEFIKSLEEELSSKITYKEFYPFFQFYGFNSVFYYNDGEDLIPILYLYSNSKKCIPFKQVPYIQFNNITIKYTRTNSMCNIGSFDFNILHALIILVKIRVDDDNDWNDLLYTLINGFVAFRKFYFSQNKKTLYDDSIFEGFVVDYKGESISPEKERRMLIQVRKKLGKPAIYRYEPGVSKEPGPYYFVNSSGNIINNKLNLKLTEVNIDKKDEELIELEVLNQLKNNDEEKEDEKNNTEIIEEKEKNNSEIIEEEIFYE